MKKSFFAIIGIAGISMFAACADTGKNNASSPAQETSKSTTRIAYVNIDTLTEHLDFFIANKEVFEKEEKKINDEISRLGNNLQSQIVAFQKKVQAGNVSQAEGEATQERLGRQQQELEMKRQTLTAQFMKKQEEFNAELKKRLDDYLEKYNKDGKYDYILSHGTGSQILWANKAMDITADIIKGMNEEGAKLGNEVSPKADSTKK
jgi:outer membrane protein